VKIRGSITIFFVKIWYAHDYAHAWACECENCWKRRWENFLFV